MLHCAVHRTISGKAIFQEIYFVCAFFVNIFDWIIQLFRTFFRQKIAK